MKERGRIVASAFSFFMFPPSPVLMHANNYGHYHGLCRDKFTKTPRRGRVETRNSPSLPPSPPAFYAILTHSRAKSRGSPVRLCGAVYIGYIRLRSGFWRSELLTCVYLPTARARWLVNCISQCTR